MERCTVIKRSKCQLADWPFRTSGRLVSDIIRYVPKVLYYITDTKLYKVVLPEAVSHYSLIHTKSIHLLLFEIVLHYHTAQGNMHTPLFARKTNIMSLQCTVSPLHFSGFYFKLYNKYVFLKKWKKTFNLYSSHYYVYMCFTKVPKNLWVQC